MISAVLSIISRRDSAFSLPPPRLYRPCSHRRIDEGLAGARKIVNVQNIAHRFAFERQANRPATLNRFNIVRHNAVDVSFRRPRVHRRKPKDARSEVSLRSVVLHVLFGDELRPFQRAVVRVFGAARLSHFFKRVGMRPVNIFRRCEDENRPRLHLTQQVYGALDVRAKCLFSFGGIFTEVRGQMNYHIVSPDAGGVQRAEHIQMSASRKVFGIEKRADVSAEITAAACD